MNVFGQLKKACLEILSSQPSGSTQGRIWYNSTTGKNEFDNGTQKRALLANDDKAVIGTSGTAGFNIRFHRAANGLLQYVLGGDVTAEGTRSTNLAEISGKTENYTDAGKPTFGNAGRLAYLNDLAQLSLDIGTSWQYLVDTNTAQTLTNKTINASNNTISNITDAMVNSGSATNGQALTANGSGGAAWVTPGKALAFGAKTANYTVLAADQFLTGDASSGAITFTIPSASGLTGQVLEFQKIDSTFNAVNITDSGSFSTSLNYQNQSVQIISDGTNWKIKNNYETPDYKCRAWVRFDATTNNNLTGTYSRTLTTVTVTATAHGHQVGHAVYLDFTTGTATDGLFTVVTVPDANTFTVTHGTSGTTSGNVTLLRKTITSSGNVQSVVQTISTAGQYAVNFSSQMKDANYAAFGQIRNMASSATYVAELDLNDSPTTLYCKIWSVFVNSAQNHTFTDSNITCWSFFQ